MMAFVLAAAALIGAVCVAAALDGITPQAPLLAMAPQQGCPVAARGKMT